MNAIESINDRHVARLTHSRCRTDEYTIDQLACALVQSPGDPTPAVPKSDDQCGTWTMPRLTLIGESRGSFAARRIDPHIRVTRLEAFGLA